MGAYLKGLDFWICMEYCSGGALDSLYNCMCLILLFILKQSPYERIA